MNHFPSIYFLQVSGLHFSTPSSIKAEHALKVEHTSLLQWRVCRGEDDTHTHTHIVSGLVLEKGKHIIYQ